MDLNINAFRIVAESTGDRPAPSPRAVAGRTGGLKGGPTRAKALSPERRKEIAVKASKARWGVSI